MRLSESRSIVNVLSEACDKAEQTGIVDVNTLLSKPEFVRFLRELWAHIPQKMRRSIARQRNKSSHVSRRVEVQQLDMPKINPPQELLADVSYWMDNPSLFFQEKGDALNLNASPIPECYQYLDRLDLRRKVDIIRARLLKIVFHRLKERLGIGYMRSNSVDDMVKIISNSGVTSRDMDDIKSKIVKWTDAGNRIDKFCRSIGSSTGHENSHLGNLFCLPEDCHDEFIRLLGLTGSGRDQKIQQIINRGILTVPDRPQLDKLAAKVFDVLWSKVNASINDIITQSPESVLGRDLEHTQNFRIEEQPSGEAREQHTPGRTDEISPVPDAGEINANFVSATTAQVPPMNTSSHSYDNPVNQRLGGFEPRNEQTSIDIVNVLNIDDMIQPILPAHGFTPPIDQVQENPRNMVVDDMLQPILSVQDCGFTYQQTSSSTNANMNQPIFPVQQFASVGNQLQDNPRNMVIDDMLQPILPARASEPPESRPQNIMADIGGVRDISQSTFSPSFTLPYFRSNATETAVSHMNQSTTQQVPTIHGLWPRMTASLNTQYQNPFYGRQPVPAV